MTVIPPFDAVSQERTSDDIETTTIRSIAERCRRHRLLRHSRHRSLLSPGRAARTVRPHLSQGWRHCWPHSLNFYHLTHRRLTWKVRRGWEYLPSATRSRYSDPALGAAGTNHCRCYCFREPPAAAPDSQRLSGGARQRASWMNKDFCGSLGRVSKN